MLWLVLLLGTIEKDCSERLTCDVICTCFGELMIMTMKWVAYLFASKQKA